MMDMKRVEELWKQIEHIGDVSNFDDDTMMALGSVFGEMGSSIKQQHTLIEKYKEALEFYADERSWTEPTESVIVGDSGPDIHEGPPAAIEESGSVAREALEGGGG